MCKFFKLHKWQYSDIVADMEQRQCSCCTKRQWRWLGETFWQDDVL